MNEMTDSDDRFEEIMNPANWPEEWRLFSWATMEAYSEGVKLFEQIGERGLEELFNDVLVQLGYQVTETPAGQKEIHLSRKELTFSIQRIARFLLEGENTGKSSQLLSSELRELGCQA